MYEQEPEGLRGEAELLTFADVVEAPEGPERERRITALVDGMSLREKIAQMSGNSTLPALAVQGIRYGFRVFKSGRNRRLGIPAIRFTDGPRGVCLGHSTCFPVAMARGATWDVELQERVGAAVGREARAQGANFYGGVCINVLRHPGWGRAQETFGEDPFHLGAMGVATLSGAQRHLMACAKHFACNSIEESRFYVDVRVDERTLREVYCPHFRRCVEAGVASVMSAYNKVNGVYCGHSEHLLRDLLKREWGFDGFVVSDFVYGIREGVSAALGGLDVEMPKKWRFGLGFARKVRRGEVPEGIIDESVGRIIRQKARFAGVGESGGYDISEVASPEHADLAREVAEKSIVLLKNEGPLLPLGDVKKLAVVGRLAALANIGDRGSSSVRPPYVVTPLEGIRRRAGRASEVIYENGRDLKNAKRCAREAEVTVVVVGLTHRQEGEYIARFMPGGDREDLSLPPEQEKLLLEVADSSERCVVVLEGGSAILLGNWKDRVNAILMAWYPGMEGGVALASVLFGDVNPGGKLPFSWPSDSSQLPFFDRNADSIEYGYYHGYRLFDNKGIQPELPFGFGLSYSTFEIGKLRLGERRLRTGDAIDVSVEVRNTGGVAGDEVVQLYIGYPQSGIERPVKELKGFQRVHLEPGESREVAFRLEAAQLAYFDAGSGSWSVEEAEYTAMVGSSSAPRSLALRESFTISGT